MQGFNYNLPRGLITWFQNFSDQIENDYSHHTSGVVLRSDSSPSSPSSSGTVSGVKAQSRFNRKDAWHSQAIKPEKMREHKKAGGRRKQNQGNREREDWRDKKKTVRRIGQPTQERQPRLRLRHPLPPLNRHNTETRREPRADFRSSVSSQRNKGG